jgi:hypothetical protein
MADLGGSHLGMYSYTGLVHYSGQCRGLNRVDSDMDGVRVRNRRKPYGERSVLGDARCRP